MRRLAMQAAIGLLSLLPCIASAGVIYRWQDITLNEGLGPVTGLLEIDYDYWHLGETVSFTINQNFNESKPDWIEDFYFNGTGLPPTGSTPVTLNERTCSPDIGCPDDLLGTQVIYGSFSFNLTFNSILTGNIYANNTSSSVRMHSDGPVWTIDDYSTDGYPSECYFHRCGGGTGLWVLDLSTLPTASPVPEPEAMAMFLVGAGIVGFGVRRRAGPWWWRASSTVALAFARSAP